MLASSQYIDLVSPEQACAEGMDSFELECDRESCLSEWPTQEARVVASIHCTLNSAFHAQT